MGSCNMLFVGIGLLELQDLRSVVNGDIDVKATATVWAHRKAAFAWILCRGSCYREV
jgi:hypothetical protein